MSSEKSSVYVSNTKLSVSILALTYFHTWAACSHSGTHILTSCLNPVLPIQGRQALVILTLVFRISTVSNSFEHRCPFLKFGTITYLAYFSRIVTSFMALCFLIFLIVFPKALLFISLKMSFSNHSLQLPIGAVHMEVS